MKRLVTVKELAERYNCSDKTARRYMRQMDHMEKPLRVTEQAVEQWELERTMGMGYDLPPLRKKARRNIPTGPVIISRVRPTEGRT